MKKTRHASYAFNVGGLVRQMHGGFEHEAIYIATLRSIDRYSVFDNLTKMISALTLAYGAPKTPFAAPAPPYKYAAQNGTVYRG